MAPLHHPVGYADGDLSRKMVVAGTGVPERLVTRADRQWRAGFAAENSGYRHDAFQHLGNRGRGQAVIAVPSLVFDRQQAGFRQPRQMTAGRLGRDAGRACQFRRRQSPSVHQRGQHVGAGGIADQGGGLGDGAGAQHAVLRCGFTLLP